MDFTTFMSMLANGALFFSRADHFSDAWEGAHTAENVRQRPLQFGASEIEAPMIMELTSKFYRSLRLHTFMSCWHLNEVESAAMWKLYVSNNEGIAIQTTFERLIGSFQGDDNELFQVHVGKVEYLNYGQDVFKEGNTFIPFLHKRLSFEHERELRAIIQAVLPGDRPLDESEPYADGLMVEVDLKTLVESIYIAPTSEDWFVALVDSAVKKYGLNLPVKHSDLSTDPVY